MKINYEYLNDYTFLKQLTLFPVKEYFVKISLLNWQEQFLQDLQGKITSGNINIDGNSAIRRTANLNMVVEDNERNNRITKENNLISINKKIYLMIGYKNPLNEYTEYEILWFPLGLFIITNISLSYGSNGINLSLQLKDKMVLLNGECGGTIPATTIFDTYQTVDENGKSIISKPTIYQIILELVNHFGKQQLGKIVISDIDDKVKQVVKWTGDKPLYILQIVKSKTIQNFITINPNVYTQKINLKIKEPNGENDYVRDANGKIKIFRYKDIDGSPFEYEQDAGFILTDFTYPNELIAAPGETVVDILDKIKTTLGNYEYFYDIYGNFIFQEIKNFVNTSPTTALLESLQAVNSNSEISAGKNANKFLIDFLEENYLYPFNNLGRKKSIKIDNDIVFSYNNNPQYNIIRNDFVIWGSRKNGQNSQVPIRYHLAIDEKPLTGQEQLAQEDLTEEEKDAIKKKYKIFKYHDDLQNQDKWAMPIYIEDETELPKNGPATGDINTFYRTKSDDYLARTTYRWEQVDGKYQWVVFPRKKILSKGHLPITYVTTDWRTQLLLQGMKDYNEGKTPNDYYAQLLVEWFKIYDIENNKFYDQVIKNPSSINYFLDFIDTPDLSELSVSNIGRRSLVKDYGNKINCVFQPYIPEIAFIGIDTLKQPSAKFSVKEAIEECKRRGLSYYQVQSSIFNGLQIGGVLNSAYEEIKQQLNYYTNYNNSVSIQTLPLFFLEPNTLITLDNEQADISGQFLIQSMSFSLDISSQLNINAIKNIVK